jgi:hypothetical protein
MPRSIIRTIAIAIAIAALAAPTALARPADMPPAVTKAASAEQHKQARRAQLNPYPTRPAQGEQANPRPETPPQAAAVADGGWDTVGLWSAVGLLALAAAVAVMTSRARRIRHGRLTA